MPPLNSFKGLKRGDSVISKQFGVGNVVSQYQKGEIIVSFSMGERRFSLHEIEIWKVPDTLVAAPKRRGVISIGEEKMSAKKFRKAKQLENNIKALDEKLARMGIRVTKKED